MWPSSRHAACRSFWNKDPKQGGDCEKEMEKVEMTLPSEAAEKQCDLLLCMLKWIAHDTLRKVLSLHQFISYVHMFTQLFMAGRPCSQAWNKLQRSHREYFHSFALIVAFIMAVSLILSFLLTTNQMLMAQSAVCWLTIILMAFMAHRKKVFDVWMTQKKQVERLKPCCCYIPA